MLNLTYIDRLHHLVRNSTLSLPTISRIFLQRNASTLRIDRSKVPELNEADLEEKHVPTGLTAKVHEFRELEKNRKRAREVLTDKLDNLYNGDDSVPSQIQRIETYKRARQDAQRQRARERKQQLKLLQESCDKNESSNDKNLDLER